MRKALEKAGVEFTNGKKAGCRWTCRPKPTPLHDSKITTCALGACQKRKGNARTMTNGSGPLAWPIPFLFPQR